MSEISRKAFTDVSTGLLNKSALQAAVGDYSQKHPQASALNSDAIGLGGVNYIHGGEVGNKFIKEVADFYTKSIDDLGIKDALVFRSGGDEFLVLFKNQADCDRF